MVRLIYRIVAMLLCGLLLTACTGDTSGPAASTSSVATSAIAPTSAGGHPTPSTSATPTAVAPAATPTSVTGSRATAGVATPGVVIPSSIADAEAEAQRHPRAPLPSQVRAAFQDSPGLAERTCVDVERHRPLAPEAGVRSGEFIAGPFAMYANEWKSQQGNFGKLWWIPLHTNAFPGLTVRAVLLDDPSIRRVFSESIVGHGSGGAFYPSTVVLPTPGRWLLVATAGPDWGCFLLTLGE